MGGNDGQYPVAPLVSAPDGTLYGTTSAGGASNAGTIYELSPRTPPKKGYVERVIYSFSGGNDGGAPLAGLLYNAGGLYGTASEAGEFGDGTAFRLSLRQGTYSLLHAFSGEPDGAHPAGGLLLVSHTLYGTTQEGGTYNEGAVFALEP